MRIEVITVVRAGIEVCFDLARSVDAHLRSLAHTGERAVAGRTSGLLELGDEVTWRGRHFGVWHSHRARITACDRPSHFRDTMVAGRLRNGSRLRRDPSRDLLPLLGRWRGLRSGRDRFRTFEHDHFCSAVDGATQMRDVLVFASPAGLLGRIVDRCVMASYLRRLLQARAALLRDEAEAFARTRNAARC